MLRDITCNVITKSHGTECHNGKVTGSYVAPILNIKENTSWHQNKQGYSKKNYDNSIYKSVQRGVLETVHGFSQFLIAVVYFDTQIRQERHHERNTQDSKEN